MAEDELNLCSITESTFLIKALGPSDSKLHVQVIYCQIIFQLYILIKIKNYSTFLGFDHRVALGFGTTLLKMNKLEAAATAILCSVG